MSENSIVNRFRFTSCTSSIFRFICTYLRVLVFHWHGPSFLRRLTPTGDQGDRCVTVPSPSASADQRPWNDGRQSSLMGNYILYVIIVRRVFMYKYISGIRLFNCHSNAYHASVGTADVRTNTTRARVVRSARSRACVGTYRVYRKKIITPSRVRVYGTHEPASS